MREVKSGSLLLIAVLPHANTSPPYFCLLFMFKMKYLEEEKRLMVEGLQQEHQATLSDLKAQVCLSVCLPLLLLLVYSIVKSKRHAKT